MVEALLVATMPVPARLSLRIAASGDGDENDGEGDDGDGTVAAAARGDLSLRKRERRTFLAKHSFRLSGLFSVIVAGMRRELKPPEAQPPAER